MMRNVDDAGPAVRVSAFVRSIRDQVGELLAGLPDLSGDERPAGRADGGLRRAQDCGNVAR